MPIPVKWNRTTAQVTPSAGPDRGESMDPRDSAVDVDSCEDLDGPVLTFSTEAWRAFLAERKAAREAGPQVRDV